MSPLARIKPAELKARLDRGEAILIIDTRSEDSWNSSDIKIAGAMRLHYSQLPEHLELLPRDRIIVTYCT